MRAKAKHLGPRKGKGSAGKGAVHGRVHLNRNGQAEHLLCVDCGRHERCDVGQLLVLGEDVDPPLPELNVLAKQPLQATALMFLDRHLRRLWNFKKRR